VVGEGVPLWAYSEFDHPDILDSSPSKVKIMENMNMGKKMNSGKMEGKKMNLRIKVGKNQILTI
jgi:hypothetical protein